MGKRAIGFAVAVMGLSRLALAADLATTLQQELQSNPPPLGAPLKAKVGAMPSMLIAGAMGEALPGYFSHNADSLRNDFGQTDVTILRMATCDSEASNAITLDSDFRAEQLKAGHSLLVLGHSKGGAEALLAVLKDPALIRDGVIENLVLINGAVGGSAVADRYALTTEKLCPGVIDLRRENSQAAFSAALAALDASDRELLASHIFYVRAAKPTADVAFVFKDSAAYLTANFGPNDGMMLPEDEYLPALGTDLGVLVADHTDLVGWGPYTGTPASLKEAFTRALMRVLFAN